MNRNRLGEPTNDKWAQFDTLSDHLRGHCKHQTEESMSEYKKHIGQGNDMMVDQLALPRDTFKGNTVEPHDWQAPEAEPVQDALFEMQEVVDGLPESELQTYKDQMLAEISDREAIVDAINRRLDTVAAKHYIGGVRSAITKQVKM
jgi:hypothetical protein|uniref:Uncharacterized protein n=1 Tax=Podoviridae sp. ctdDI2 TaxID=2826567 RepID=A0A8S5NPQ3_9CAUD|nr:MAG TPA: hypothetical protein [Podoviridae sp. ctdDI2]